ncbi:unnamed protein product [Orchesella dallaii]|uniref:BTB domain-containing protein n=1 Tax=Orchesella dallaii TaxID=48710 RepID=A0ABP1RDW3_9HEXA
MRVTVKLTTHDENQSARQVSLPILYDGDHDPTKAMVKKALDEQIHCDFELVADNGARIRCHKLFLACQSEFFKRMFETNCVETLENACKLKQSEETVRAFIKYLYSGDLDGAKKSQPIVFNLMEMAHCYNIPYLENAMKKIILDLPITSLDVNVALLMFSFASKVEGYEDIKEKTTLLIRWKPKEVLECEALKSILKYELDTVKQLLAIGLNQ